MSTSSVDLRDMNECDDWLKKRKTKRTKMVRLHEDDRSRRVRKPIEEC